MESKYEKKGQLSSNAIQLGSDSQNCMPIKETKDCKSLKSTEPSLSLHPSSLNSSVWHNASTSRNFQEFGYETCNIQNNDAISTAKSKCHKDTLVDQINNIKSVSTCSPVTLPSNASNMLKQTLSTHTVLIDSSCDGVSAVDNNTSVTGKSNESDGLNRQESYFSDSDEDNEGCDEKEFEVIIYDPTLFKPLQTQIAGHGSEGDGEKGFLQRPDGRLLKPVQAPPRGRRELEFYKKINSSKDPVDIRLRKCIPEFFGVEKVGFRNGITVTEEFLIIRDITEGFTRPAIMDIKIGSRTWGPDAGARKRVLEDSKYAGTKHPFGFSILGLIVHSLKWEDDEIREGCLGKKYNKSFGKNLKTEDVNTVPEIFFDASESSHKIAECVEIMTKQIRTIYETFKSQTKYKIYGSSLLMAYDADAIKRFKKGEMGKKELEKYVNVKLIDFAHVFPSQGERDDNFLRGLDNLLSLFEDFYKRLFPESKF